MLSIRSLPLAQPVHGVVSQTQPHSDAMMDVADSIIQAIAAALQLKAPQIARTVELLENGNTVPFIARYRKEITGALDEEQIRTIQDRYAYATELQARKTVVLDTIAAAGKLTDELR